MRKLLIALGILMAVPVMPLNTPAIGYAQQETPAYAKWGKLAVKETQLKYPNAKIRDYLHEGRETSGDTTIEKFKLWLQEGNKEFGLYVTITFATDTEKVVHIKFQETTR